MIIWEGGRETGKEGEELPLVSGSPGGAVRCGREGSSQVKGSGPTGRPQEGRPQEPRPVGGVAQAGGLVLWLSHSPPCVVLAAGQYPVGSVVLSWGLVVTQSIALCP